MSSSDTAAFESAFVAVTYLLGRRTDLTAGLESAGDAAHRLAALLAAPERTQRARVLSTELSPIASALAARAVS